MSPVAKDETYTVGEAIPKVRRLSKNGVFGKFAAICN
jgi:hypothetical protein